jgi:EAL domain-containing protein (putative c-di-GMP-specific phosphodiesterase class I)/DNA-binding response OmpR family regulator
VRAGGGLRPHVTRGVMRPSGAVRVSSTVPKWGARDATHTTILVVDDDPAVRSVFCAALEHGGYRTHQASSAAAALEVLHGHAIDLALVDLDMPGGSGIDLVTTVRADPHRESLRILLVSGDGGMDSKLAGLAAGANDYLVKPVALEELLARVSGQLRDRSLWLAQLDRQLADRSRLARRIAETDPTLPLAGLERELLEILKEGLHLTELRLRPPVDAGDEALSITAVADGTRMRIPLRFAGVLTAVAEATVDGGAERALSTLSDLAPQIAAVAADGVARESSTADARAWVERLVDGSGIRPVYQPIVRLRDGQVVGYEGLTRFDDGSRPDLAFARAARAGIGPELELAAIDRLLIGAVDLPQDAWLSLNVSAATLLTEALPDRLRTTDRPLTLEVTENEHVRDYPAVREVLGRLPGVRLAVDDAGAGYASLRHIFELRPHVIKLDRSWIAEIDGDPIRQALVHGLIGFSSAFDAGLVAEGVERPEEAEVLIGLGVGLGQGFHFGAPAPALEAGRGTLPAADAT